MYRFLIGRKWLIRILAGIVLVVAFVRLGMWQLDRADEREAANTLLETNLAADPVPVADLLSTDEPLAEDDQWRRVVARGHYDTEHQLLLRLRPVDGQTGVHVITPLVTDDGDVLLVDRGFVASAGAELPEVADPAGGEVEVTARVRPSENDRDGLGGDPDEGTIRFMDVDALADYLDEPTYRAWAELTAEVPESPDTPASDAPVPIAAPEIESGPHLSYALQWFAFAVTGIVGFVLLIRMESRGASGASDAADTQVDTQVDTEPDALEATDDIEKEDHPLEAP